MTTDEKLKLTGKIDELIAIADRDYADEMSNSAATGELWDREIDVPVELLRSVRAALRAPEADAGAVAILEAGM